MDGELCYTTCCYCHGIPVAGGESFSFPFQRKEPGPKRSCAVSCSWPVTELGLEPGLFTLGRWWGRRALLRSGKNRTGWSIVISREVFLFVSVLPPTASPRLLHQHPGRSWDWRPGFERGGLSAPITEGQSGFFFFFNFHWRIIALQYRVGYCRTAT